MGSTINLQLIELVPIGRTCITCPEYPRMSFFLCQVSVVEDRVGVTRSTTVDVVEVQRGVVITLNMKDDIASQI